MMKLSVNFDLAEFVQSPTAKRYNIALNPDKRERENLRALVAIVLQPIRDHYGQVKITSGYRSVKLNSKIRGSSPTSQHLCKQGNSAADFKIIGKEEFKHLKKVFAWIVLESDIEYDQIILYNNWIHISYDRGDRQQKNAFRYMKWRKNKYKLVNEKWIKKWYVK